MANLHKPNPQEHGETNANASKPSARPASQREMFVYSTEPERASDGIDEAIRLLESMCDANWQTRRDAALTRLRHARPLIDQNILRTSERS